GLHAAAVGVALAGVSAHRVVLELNAALTAAVGIGSAGRARGGRGASIRQLRQYGRAAARECQQGSGEGEGQNMPKSHRPSSQAVLAGEAMSTVERLIATLRPSTIERQAAS